MAMIDRKWYFNQTRVSRRFCQKILIEFDICKRDRDCSIAIIESADGAVRHDPIG